MPKLQVGSTTIRGGWRATLSDADAKREQEKLVATAFAQARFRGEGTPASIEMLSEPRQPPDALCRIGNKVIGAELVELEGAYAERAFIEMLTDEFYLESEKRGFASLARHLSRSFGRSTRHSDGWVTDRLP